MGLTRVRASENQAVEFSRPASVIVGVPAVASLNLQMPAGGGPYDVLLSRAHVARDTARPSGRY